jgi:hypothetical protein
MPNSENYRNISEYDYGSYLQIKDLFDHAHGLFTTMNGLTEQQETIRNQTQLRFLSELTKTCEQDSPTRYFSIKPLIDLGFVSPAGRPYPKRNVAADSDEQYALGVMHGERNRIDVHCSAGPDGQNFSIKEAYRLITDTARNKSGRAMYIVGTIEETLNIEEREKKLQGMLSIQREESYAVIHGRIYYPNAQDKNPITRNESLSLQDMQRTAAILGLAYAPTYPIKKLFEQPKKNQ